MIPLIPCFSGTQQETEPTSVVCGPEEGILDLWSWRLTSKRNTERKKGLLCLFLVHAWPDILLAGLCQDRHYRGRAWGRKGSQAARGTPSMTQFPPGKPYLLRLPPPSKLSCHLETVPNYNQMQSLLKALRPPELFVEVFDKTSNIAPRNPTADPTGLCAYRTCSFAYRAPGNV